MQAIELPVHITGHCHIRDPDTGEVLVDKPNAINPETMSYALALSLADRPNGSIMQMVFGNGASSVSAVGGVTYLPPNVAGMDATLYNQTYVVFVNDLSPQDTNPTYDYMRVNHSTGTTYSDVVVTCMLNYGEPSGQMALDNSVENNGTFIFDEIGLKTYDASSGLGWLLTHVIFHPVQKSLNRRIEIVYTLRLSLS